MTKRSRPTASRAGESSTVFEHTNRHGITYYLHAGQTRAGRPRYFVATTSGPGALPAPPDGYQVVENINGVVSVARSRRGAPTISEQDLALVRSALAKQAARGGHQVAVSRGELVIYEPRGAMSELSELFGRLAVARSALPPVRTRFEPVLKFVPQGAGIFTAQRMTYRGDGGWSHPLRTGTLASLVGELVKHLGRDSFFELF